MRLIFIYLKKYHADCPTPCLFGHHIKADPANPIVSCAFASPMGLELRQSRLQAGAGVLMNVALEVKERDEEIWQF